MRVAGLRVRVCASGVCVFVAHILQGLYYYYVLLFMNQLQLMSVCARNDFLVIQASQTRRAAERQLDKQPDRLTDRGTDKG